MAKTMGLLLLGLLLVGLTFLATRQPSLVEYDMNDTIVNFHQSIGQSELSDEQRDKEIARFTQTLDDVVRDYANSHHVVILVSPAVVSGAVDVTKDIQNSLLQALQAQNTAKRNKANEVTPK
jgi:conjugal transfer pilin signal peptidase TrbI